MRYILIKYNDETAFGGESIDLCDHLINEFDNMHIRAYIAEHQTQEALADDLSFLPYVDVEQEQTEVEALL